MSTAKSILGTVPVMQSLAVASEAYGMVSKKKKKKKLLKSTINIFAGAAMTQATAQIIGDMP
jgi:ABC-type molybdate transport system substrate-binding protein